VLSPFIFAAQSPSGDTGDTGDTGDNASAISPIVVTTASAVAKASTFHGLFAKPIAATPAARAASMSESESPTRTQDPGATPRARTASRTGPGFGFIRLGSAYARAALIYQHTNREADHGIADAMDNAIKALRRKPSKRKTKRGNEGEKRAAEAG
jgi:hypothetical protein